MMIQNSPIYNLSMCSLENFHTNFIYWLGSNYPNESLKLFIPGKSVENIKFENQVKHNEYIFDLCVTMGNNNEEILIIENKLKSFPTEKQLTEYSDAFEGKNAAFILLSLAPKTKLPEKWQFLSYAELANRMHKVFDNADFLNEYHKYLVKDYISVIETISKNFPQNKSMKYDFYDVTVVDDLKDIYIKYRTSELCSYIDTTANLSATENLSATVDFRNKQGIINVSYKFEDYNIIFAIQIQHKEYRYGIRYGDKTENELRETIANKLVNNGLWFNGCTESYPNAKNYPSKKFCGYKPNFIYRYQTLEKMFNKNKMSDITYREIAEKVSEDITALMEHKDKIVNLIPRKE